MNSAFTTDSLTFLTVAQTVFLTAAQKKWGSLFLTEEREIRNCLAASWEFQGMLKERRV